jgi:hypothetical protein
MDIVYNYYDILTHNLLYKHIDMEFLILFKIINYK